MSKLGLFVPTKSESHRQKKVAEEIRYHLGNALARGDLPAVRSSKTGKFVSVSNPITITRIEISADLKHVNVYVTSLGGTEQDRALEFMTLQRGYLRKLIGSKMQLRYTPDLHIRIDESFAVANDMMQKISAVIESDNKKAQLTNSSPSTIEEASINDQNESVLDE